MQTTPVIDDNSGFLVKMVIFWVGGGGYKLNDSARLYMQQTFEIVIMCLLLSFLMGSWLRSSFSAKAHRFKPSQWLLPLKMTLTPNGIKAQGLQNK